MMGFSRMKWSFVCIFICASVALSLASDDADYQGEPKDRRRRLIGIYSRPSESDEKHVGWKNMGTHLRNAFHGGTIGLNLDLTPLKKFTSKWTTKIRDFFTPPKKYTPEKRDFNDEDGSNFLHPRANPKKGELEREP